MRKHMWGIIVKEEIRGRSVWVTTSNCFFTKKEAEQEAKTLENIKSIWKIADIKVIKLIPQIRWDLGEPKQLTWTMKSNVPTIQTKKSSGQ